MTDIAAPLPALTPLPTLARYAIMIDVGYIYASAGELLFSVSSRREYRVDTDKLIGALSRHADGAQFVSLELGHAVVQEPVRRHGWKKALWSVHGSRLTYLVEGHTHTVSIREMTAWRGAWYVTRLR